MTRLNQQYLGWRGVSCFALLEVFLGVFGLFGSVHF